MRDFLQRTLARQLGNPSGPLGSVVARVLNKGNLKPIEGAVAALGDCRGRSVADIGFGGGIGLDLLLDAVGDGGTVHGVEPSTSMLARARKQRRADLDGGRLVLHEATMATLPFGDGALDGWISLNTVYFIADLESALAELARVLAPGRHGVLGIADPTWLGSQPFAQHGFIVRPVDDVVAAMRAAGLAVTVSPLSDGRSEAPYNLLVCSREI